MCESKVIYMSPGSPETRSRAPQTNESAVNLSEEDKKMIKEFREEIKRSKEYKEGFEKYIRNRKITKTYNKKLSKWDAINSGIEMIRLFAKTLSQKQKKSKEFGNFVLSLSKDISMSTEKYLDEINKNIPVSIQLGPGSSLEFFNKEKNFSIKLDLKVYSPRLNLIKKHLDALKKLRDRKEKGRNRIQAATRARLASVKKSVRPEENFSLLANKSLSKYLKKQGNIYVVDFKKGNRIDRKAEKNTRIHDLLDLSRLKGGNMYVRIYIDGVSPAGVKHQYWAYYHPSQNTFIVEGTTKRARIFHGTKISHIQYRVSRPKKAATPKVAPKAKPKPQISEKKRREERLGRIEQKNWDNVYRNDRYIFENKRFYVPGFLQDDSDFEKNWGRIDGILEASLSGAPFNLQSSTARRKYIQDVIQGNSIFDLNTRLYAQDFFETKINGKYIYKGGYKKFLKDFRAVDKKMAELGMDYRNPENEEERTLAKKWKKLQAIAFGLARVFDALGRLSLHKKTPETNNDRFRVKTLGLKQLSARELEKLGTLQYHSLESLLHKRDHAPKGVDIGINHIVVVSDANGKVNKFYDSAIAWKKSIEYRRAKLQFLKDKGIKKGAWRVLKRFSHKEKNKMSYINHKIAKEIVMEKSSKI